MNLKTIFVTAIVSTTIFATGAMAQDGLIRIGAGKSGGGYDSAAKDLCSGLLKNDIACEVVNYDGSEDITNAIEAGVIDYGISQPDVPFLLDVNPQRTASLFEEVGVLACNKGSGIKKLSKLGKGDVVVVGPIGSGGALSWDGMVRSEKEGSWSASGWIEAAPDYMDLTDGLLAVEDGDADCIFAVARPTSSTFKDWAASGLVFADINDGDIDDLQRNGESVYPVEQREVAGEKVDVVILPASLYRSTGAEAKSTDALALLRRLVRSVR